MSFFDRLRAKNLERCALWHHGGVVSWSPSQWFTAMIGELGEYEEVAEVCTHGGMAERKRELADVVIYLDLLWSRLDLPAFDPDYFLTDRLAPFPCAERQAQERKLSKHLCLMGDLIKKLERASDGIVGNRVPVDALRQALVERSYNALFIIHGLCRLDRGELPDVIAAKFDEVSRRNHFDVLLGEGEAE